MYFFKKLNNSNNQTEGWKSMYAYTIVLYGQFWFGKPSRYPAIVIYQPIPVVYQPTTAPVPLSPYM